MTEYSYCYIVPLYGHVGVYSTDITGWIKDIQWYWSGQTQDDWVYLTVTR